MRGKLHRAGFLTVRGCACRRGAVCRRSLRTFPDRGRVVPEILDAAVRELLVKSYRLIYEIRESGVIVLAFLHRARRFSAGLV